MKITHTEIYRFSIRMEPFVIATGTMDYAQNIFVRIYTDSGIYGVGECSAFPMIVGETQDTCLVLAQDFARLWKGKNPLALTDRLTELDTYIARNTTAKSAFDIALHDLAAKAAGLPLFKYLGGAVRPITTDITIGIGSPEEMAAKAVLFKKQGAEVLKVKLGKAPEADIARIRAIRDAIGLQTTIRVDANQGWTYDDAVRALQGLQIFDIEFCEQPMRSYDDHLLAQLRNETTIPLMADESCYDHRDATRLAVQAACDYVNIKFSKSGGIAEALRIQQAMGTYGIPCMIGGMLESRVGLSAAVHFAYAAPNVRFFDMDTCLIGHLEDPVVGGVRYAGYDLAVPDLPGIGADVDDIFLQNCERWTI